MSVASAGRPRSRAVSRTSRQTMSGSVARIRRRRRLARHRAGLASSARPISTSAATMRLERTTGSVRIPPSTPSAPPAASSPSMSGMPSGPSASLSPSGVAGSFGSVSPSGAAGSSGSVSSGFGTSSPGRGASSPIRISSLAYSGTTPRLGVGSKRTQPSPSKCSSGQACRLSELTMNSLGTCGLRAPGRNPTATRDGMSSVRAMSAIALAKCTQYPLRSMRNCATMSAPEPS